MVGRIAQDLMAETTSGFLSLGSLFSNGCGLLECLRGQSCLMSNCEFHSLVTQRVTHGLTAPHALTLRCVLKHNANVTRHNTD